MGNEQNEGRMDLLMMKREQMEMANKIKKEAMKRDKERIKEMRRRHQEEEDAKQRLLTEAEVSMLREGLKKKWEYYNNKYTGLTHKKVYDNLVLLRK